MLRNPQWRDSNLGINYPFEDEATLVNKAGNAFDKDTFIDAAIYPAGGSSGAYISSVEVSADAVVITIGDSTTATLCSGTFSPFSPASEIRLVDRLGRSAGLLVTDAVRMAIFQAWGTGIHAFLPDQSGIVAACYYPVPANAVLGFELDDGNVLDGDVYIVGEDGINLSCFGSNEWAACGVPEQQVQAIKVSAVGDPLFRREACAPDLFATPSFIREIVFQKGDTNITVGPGSRGNVLIAQASILTEETVLRIRTDDRGMLIEAVGERLEGII